MSRVDLIHERSRRRANKIARGDERSIYLAQFEPNERNDEALKWDKEHGINRVYP